VENRAAALAALFALRRLSVAISGNGFAHEQGVFMDRTEHCANQMETSLELGAASLAV